MSTDDKKYTIKDLEKKKGQLTVGRILKAFRLGNEMTQAELAKKIGISAKNLSDIENGRQSVSPEKASKIAKKIGHSEIVLVECALNEQLKSSRMDYVVTLKSA